MKITNIKKTRARNTLLVLMSLLMLSGSFSSLAAAPEAANASVISAFSPLAAELSAISNSTKPAPEALIASFPTSLSATLSADGSSIEIPVTWNCNEDYGQEFSTYTFSPVWDAQLYQLAKETDPSTVPMITLTITPPTPTAAVTFTNKEQAKSALESLAAEKDLFALVYLCDSYDMKKEASASAETVCTVSSGQSVSIKGTDLDPDGNIWYLVSLSLGDTSYQGYIEREFLAYSDEKFIAFEKSNINIYRQRSAVTAFNLGNRDIEFFPASYQDALTKLRQAHPKWVFVKRDTGLNWADAVKSENSNTRSLVPISSPDAWKNGAFDNGWAYATDGIVAHYMDPRNFLNETSIFQFELLTYNQDYHTESAVGNILKSTFMSGLIPDDNRTYASAFYAIGNTLDVSPFHLACRVYQEQGRGTSPLISGKYEGYLGYYNYFNIGASGKGNDAVISGLKKAQEYGWNSRYAALRGGAEQISKYYIRQGQNTLYLQKFNVDPEAANPIYTHQYMQNIMAPSSEASNIKKAYTNTGSLENSFVFRIPVYNDMPSSPCPKPTKSDAVALDKTTLSIAVDKTDTLSPLVNGSPASAADMIFSSQNPAVAVVDNNGIITGISPGTTIISCSKSGGTTASCQVTVTKGNPSYTVPALSGFTYDPSIILGNIALPSGWTWTAPGTVPTPAAVSYPAVFTPSDTVKYNQVTVNVPLTVSKGVPAYKAPTALQGALGSKVSSVILPAGWIWDAPDTLLSKEGTLLCTASYNPNGALYETVASIQLSIAVVHESKLCTSHTFGDWQSSVAATCTAAGSESRSCTKCGNTEIRAVNALGHNFTSKVTTEPTETTEGVRTYTCSRCNAAYTERVERVPHTHNVTEKVTKEPTCTEKGSKTLSCPCGQVSSQEIPALSHSYESSVTKEATEKEEGVRTYRCSRCSDTYTEKISKLPPSHKHSYTENLTRTATCTEKGTKTFTCSCGDSYTQDIDAYGHDMKNQVCTRCGYSEVPPAAAPPAAPATPPAAENKAPDENDTPAKSPAASNGGTAAAPDSSKNSDTISVDMRETTVLYEETIASVRGEDVELVLNVGHNISWIIQGKNVVGDNANGIDMGVAINQGKIPADLLDATAAGNYYMELDLAHEGDFDFLPSMIINMAVDNAGRYANLFYFNSDSQELEFIASSQISDKGDATFVFEHASAYAVIVSDTALDSASTAENKTSDETVQPVLEDPSLKADTTDSETGIKTQTIFIIVIIFVVSIGAGIGIFLYFKKKEEEEEDELWADEEDDETEDAEEIVIDDSVSYEKDTTSRENEAGDEFDETGDSDFIDDYHEPAVNIKKTGKVIKISPKPSERDADDEFDGFE